MRLGLPIRRSRRAGSRAGALGRPRSPVRVKASSSWSTTRRSPRLGDDRLRDLEEPLGPDSSLAEELRRRTDGHTHEGRIELERMVTGVHLRDEPSLGAGDRACTDRRYQAGSDERGLPLPLGPTTAMNLVEPSGLDMRSSNRSMNTAEEVAGVRLEERTHPCRVADVGGDAFEQACSRPQGGDEVGKSFDRGLGAPIDLRSMECTTDVIGRRSPNVARAKATNASRSSVPRPRRRRWRSR